MRNLREIDIDVDPYFGIKTANTIEIVNCKKLKKINLDFDYQDVEIDLEELNLIFDKIATDRQKFLIKMNKNKTYRDKEDVVISRYYLNEEDKEKYFTEIYTGLSRLASVADLDESKGQYFSGIKVICSEPMFGEYSKTWKNFAKKEIVPDF